MSFRDAATGTNIFQVDANLLLVPGQNEIAVFVSHCVLPYYIEKTKSYGVFGSSLDKLDSYTTQSIDITVRDEHGHILARFLSFSNQ